MSKRKLGFFGLVTLAATFAAGVLLGIEWADRHPA